MSRKSKVVAVAGLVTCGTSCDQFVPTLLTSFVYWWGLPVSSSVPEVLLQQETVTAKNQTPPRWPKFARFIVRNYVSHAVFVLLALIWSFVSKKYSEIRNSSSKYLWLHDGHHIPSKKNVPPGGTLFLLGDITTILNLILKSCHIIIALLHNTVWSKYHKTALIGTLTCFIYTFCQWKSFVFKTKRINKTC